jgi:AraC-like DNA-binding protein
MDAQVGLLDHGVRPYRGNKVGLAHDFASVTGKQNENIEGAAADLNGFPIGKQDALLRQKLERTELERFRRHVDRSPENDPSSPVRPVLLKAYAFLHRFTSLYSPGWAGRFILGVRRIEVSMRTTRTTETAMVTSLATASEKPRYIPVDQDPQVAANDTTFMMTAVASADRGSPVSPGPDHLPVARLLGYARAALSDDVAAARDYLGRAMALLEAPTAATPPRREPLPAGPHRGGLARWQINRIAAYIDANIGAAIKATDLAALVRLSASHFFHAFKDSFAETPLTYVARRRMALAKKLMLTTDEPLAQIALACGLCDQSHFTRVFRRVVGTSPHAWRREHASGPIAAAPGTLEESTDTGFSMLIQ